MSVTIAVWSGARSACVADAAAQLVEAEYETSGRFDEVEAMTSKAIVHDELKPAGTFPDRKHSRAQRDTNLALDFICDAATSRRDPATTY